MEKNAFNRITLENLLDILDARTMINVFVGDENGSKSIKFLKVYDFLSEPELMKKYKDRWVIGIHGGKGYTNILIKPE